LPIAKTHDARNARVELRQQRTGCLYLPAAPADPQDGLGGAMRSAVGAMVPLGTLAPSQT